MWFAGTAVVWVAATGLGIYLITHFTFWGVIAGSALTLTAGCLMTFLAVIAEEIF